MLSLSLNTPPQAQLCAGVRLRRDSPFLVTEQLHCQSNVPVKRALLTYVGLICATWGWADSPVLSLSFSSIAILVRGYGCGTLFLLCFLFPLHGTNLKPDKKNSTMYNSLTGFLWILLLILENM